MEMIVQKIGWVMLLISLFFLAFAWLGPIWEADFEMRESVVWAIETTLTSGIYLLIGGLIAEALGSKKDE
jgi:hypothetical protein